MKIRVSIREGNEELGAAETELVPSMERQLEMVAASMPGIEIPQIRERGSEWWNRVAFTFCRMAVVGMNVAAEEITKASVESLREQIREMMKL